MGLRLTLAGRRPGATRAKRAPGTPLSWEVDTRRPSLFMNIGGPAIFLFFSAHVSAHARCDRVHRKPLASSMRSQRSTGRFTVTFKRPDSSVWQECAPNPTAHNLPQLGPNSGSRNYQQLQSKLGSTVSKCFLLFREAMSKISVRRLVYFSSPNPPIVKSRRASMYLQEQARTGLPV